MNKHKKSVFFIFFFFCNLKQCHVHVHCIFELSPRKISISVLVRCIEYKVLIDKLFISAMFGKSQLETWLPDRCNDCDVNLRWYLPVFLIKWYSFSYEKLCCNHSSRLSVGCHNKKHRSNDSSIFFISVINEVKVNKIKCIKWSVVFWWNYCGLIILHR